MKKKIEVKPKSWQLDGYNGKITFSVKTTHLLTPQNHTELLTRIGNMIANELENANGISIYFLSKKYKVCTGVVKRVVLRQAWKHVL